MPKVALGAMSRYARDALALLGRSIRVARIERRLRMTETAERAGISRALLRRVERGEPGVSIGAVFEVAAIVGVSLFEMERGRLTEHLADQGERLGLLPPVVRLRRIDEAEDDF